MQKSLRSGAALGALFLVFFFVLPIHTGRIVFDGPELGFAVRWQWFGGLRMVNELFSWAAHPEFAPLGSQIGVKNFELTLLLLIVAAAILAFAALWIWLYWNGKHQARVIPK